MDTQLSEEDRILRVWTPVILRTILIVATVALIVGLVMMIWRNPAFYIGRFDEIQKGIGIHHKEALSVLILTAVRGNSHAILTLGLMILTLVPLGRVAFTFVLFLKERDQVFIVATAYVLIGLIVGVVLGRVG
ncbi:MAG: DUF1634 domain-containing protein [Candidatus Binataceae bacterium]